MNRLIPDTNTEGQFKTVKQVHEILVAALAELHGCDELKVGEAPQPEAGIVDYNFNDLGYRCTARVAPLSDRGATVVVHVRLGRFYVGYRRALRWLACNRAGNSVGVTIWEPAIANRELCVCSNRVTMPGDKDGVRETLMDVHVELQRLAASLEPWFPQIVEGSKLAEWEEQRDEFALAILASPQQFLTTVKKDPELSAKVDPGIVVAVALWLERYDMMLEWACRALEDTAEMDKNLERKIHFMSQRMIALSRLACAEESLAVLDQLENISPEIGGGAVTHRMGNLYKLQRYDEVLEAARSGLHDGNPRVWFWRSLAHARMGNVDASKEAYSEYETKIGTDIIGRKQLAAVLPEEKDPDEETKHDDTL